MVPGDAGIGACEGALRPPLEREVVPQEGQVPGLGRAVGQGLEVGLGRHDQQHAEDERHQKALDPQPREGPVAHPPLVAFAQQEIHRQPRDQEHQRHAPLVEHHHRRLQPGRDVLRFHVPAPGHVEHAHVVEDQQPEGDGPQGVDVVAAAIRGCGHGGFLLCLPVPDCARPSPARPP